MSELGREFHQPTLIQIMLAEILGTGFLLCGVVGSGIMGERLSQGNAGIALLANALATGALLPVIITMFAPISGAHFNPVVSLMQTLTGHLSKPRAMAYLFSQVIGALAGVALAHFIFEEPIVQLGQHVRHGIPQIVSEALATMGLLLLIRLAGKRFGAWMPALVGLYITSAYWFTSSTSFANPAVTLARGFTNTFSGIRLQDVPGFWIGQLGGLALALGIIKIFTEKQKTESNSN